MTAALTTISVLAILWLAALTASATYVVRTKWYVDWSDVFLHKNYLMSLGAAIVGTSYLIWG